MPLELTVLLLGAVALAVVAVALFNPPRPKSRRVRVDR